MSGREVHQLYVQVADLIISLLASEIHIITAVVCWILCLVSQICTVTPNY